MTRLTQRYPGMPNMLLTFPSAFDLDFPIQIMAALKLRKPEYLQEEDE